MVFKVKIQRKLPLKCTLFSLSKGGRTTLLFCQKQDDHKDFFYCVLPDR